jgi:hypothetical protein
MYPSLLIGESTSAISIAENGISKRFVSKNGKKNFVARCSLNGFTKASESGDRKTMKLQKITSKKHPGSIFFKIAGTDIFVCKFYAGQEEAAHRFWAMMEAINESSHRCSCCGALPGEPHLKDCDLDG